jgi:hypothetical protein
MRGSCTGNSSSAAGGLAALCLTGKCLDACAVAALMVGGPIAGVACWLAGAVLIGAGIVAVFKSNQS